MRDLELTGHASHGGALQTMMRMQAAPGLEQNRLGWLKPELKTKEKRRGLVFLRGARPIFRPISITWT